MMLNSAKRVNVAFVLAIVLVAVATLAIAIVGALVQAPPDGHSIVKVGSTIFEAYAPRRLRSLAPTSEHAIRGILVAADPFDGCESQVNGELTGNKIVFVGDGNCTLVDKILLIQTAASVLPAAVIGIYSDAITVGNETDSVVIPTFLIYPEDVVAFQLQLGHSTTVYMGTTPMIDPALFCLMAMAIITLLIASSWRSFYILKDIQAVLDREVRSDVRSDHAPDDERDSSFKLTIATAICMIFSAAASILIFFFFPFVLVYVSMVGFIIASFSSVYTCQIALLECSALRHNRIITALYHRRDVYISCLKLSLSFVNIFLLIIDAIAVALWAVYRNEPNMWILQDLFGLCLILYMLQAILLPNIKVATVLLCLAFIYDIIFVFALPVMVTVATGNGTGEQIPLLLRFPKFLIEFTSFAGLGYGDVALPGLLLVYLKKFDLRKRYLYARHHHHYSTGYFFWGMIGYAAGMLCTFVALGVMRVGQPALLYLVPGTLLTTILVACKRREFNKIWTGVIETEDEDLELQQQRVGTLLATEQPIDNEEEAHLDQENINNNEEEE